MTVETALRAIANPTRREMLRLVWDAERPASDIARTLRLSRPATSQHLRVLREAELVTVRAEGSRRLYSVRADRLEQLRAFLESFWGDRLSGMAAAAERRHRGRS